MPMPMPVPVLVMIVGPPAVGKMTVGAELCRRTGFRLMHNHMTIDLVTRFFEFGTPPFIRLVDAIRQQLLDEISRSELPGLVFTLVWAFGSPGEEEAVEAYIRPFRSRGGRVIFVELEATQEERLARNSTEQRMTEKPHTRDLVASRELLLRLDREYTMNTPHGSYAHREDWLRIDSTHRSPEQVAEIIVDRYLLQ